MSETTGTEVDDFAWAEALVGKWVMREGLGAVGKVKSFRRDPEVIEFESGSTFHAPRNREKFVALEPSEIALAEALPGAVRELVKTFGRVAAGSGARMPVAASIIGQALEQQARALQRST